MMNPKTILCTVGTRPEAIKMAPVILALREEPWARVRVLATAQHRQMLDQVLDFFGIRADLDLDIMEPGQQLPRLTARLIERIDQVLEAEAPDLVLAQGDTTTVMTTALAAFYRRIRFGHVEAGLRTGQKYFPWPEEINRRIAGVMADFHFTPTPAASENLRREAVDESTIHYTQNTVIDALYWARERVGTAPYEVPVGARVILMTAHRRENFGEPLREICQAVLELVERYEDVSVVYPVHPNPNVLEVVTPMLGTHPRIQLIEPLDYAPFVAAMQAATLILTDSGGVQEEAPALGKPVLVMRDETERPEAVEAGVVRLVGPHRKAIVDEASRLLDDPAYYATLAKGVSPYGDGRAASRIVACLRKALCGEAS